MQCVDAQRLVPAYLDGEIDLTKSVEIQQHLEDCSGCQRVYENEQALKAAVRADGLYYVAPLGLQMRIMRSLPQEKRETGRGWKWGWPAYGLAATALLFLFAIALYRSATNSQSDFQAQEVLSSHVRSLMAAHLFDVRSTDKHTVKPWFNGKIDYAPVVEDLTPQGFPLLGGRLDYLNGRQVAALIYQRQKHIINLYLWPAPKEPNAALKSISLRGFYLWHWTKFGMVYWAVSDLNSSELQDFALHIQNQPPATR